jgi:hypothetical protein
MQTESTPTLLPDPAPAGWTLRAVKVNHALSDETLNFSASLYVDGVKVAKIGNHGHGGPDMVDWTSPEDEARTLAATPAVANEWGEPGDVFDTASSFEITIAEMVQIDDDRKACRRHAKKGAFPIMVYAISGSMATIIGVRDPANIPRFLAEAKADSYRVFTFPEFGAPA